MSVRRSAALALVAALLLAGCQDEPAPRFEPTPSDSSSPTEPESEEPDAQTAEEFIDEWFDLAVDFQNSGDPESLAAVSQGCRPCQSLIESVEAIYAKGGNVQIQQMEVVSVRKVADGEFEATVEASETTVREDADSAEETIPANRNRYRIYLRRSQGEWNMANYEDTPS